MKVGGREGEKEGGDAERRGERREDRKRKEKERERERDSILYMSPAKARWVTGAQVIEPLSVGLRVHINQKLHWKQSVDSNLTQDASIPNGILISASNNIPSPPTHEIF